jgi:hypothetical protein
MIRAESWLRNAKTDISTETSRRFGLRKTNSFAFLSSFYKPSRQTWQGLALRDRGQLVFSLIRIRFQFRLTTS